MSSPTHHGLPRQGSSLLLDEPYTPRGSTLASLMRRRSSTNLHSYGRDEEEAIVGALTPSGVLTPRGQPDPFLDDEDARRLHDERRLSAILNNPQMRSMRLIGKAKRYRWERYWKTEEQLKTMTAPLREYYERNNMLIQQYLYIDRLLNSSLPHDLLNEYNGLHSTSYRSVAVPATISEEPVSVSPNNMGVSPTLEVRAARAGMTSASSSDGLNNAAATAAKKVKRTPKAIYRPAETTPLLEHHGDDSNDDDHHDPDDYDEYLTRVRSQGALDNEGMTAAPIPIDGSSSGPAKSSSAVESLATIAAGSASENNNARRAPKPNTDSSALAPVVGGPGSKSPTLADIPLLLEDDENIDSTAPIVTLAIYVNLAANAILLAGKAAVVVSVPSISVLASLVDAVLDFLSTAIVWTTTWLISNQDQYRYPVGRRRLEPLGVLVFSIIMITSFVQVMLEAVQRLASDNHDIIELYVAKLRVYDLFLMLMLVPTRIVASPL